jgi:hypothetical protein
MLVPYKENDEFKRLRVCDSSGRDMADLWIQILEDKVVVATEPYLRADFEVDGDIYTVDPYNGDTSLKPITGAESVENYIYQCSVLQDTIVKRIVLVKGKELQRLNLLHLIP